MQEIAFSVPSGASDGVNTIKAVVGGVDSTTIPFTVRPGNIYFIKSTGNDSTGDGSWNSPWLTYNSVMAGGVKLSAGDTVYSIGVDTTTGIRIGGSASLVGTASNPISLIAYPNTTCDISGEGGNDAVICNWYPSTHNTAYVNLSKLSVTARGNSGVECNGITVNPHNRIVGLEITGPTVYGGYGGAITCSGSDSNPPEGGKYFGIYIHNYGYRSTTPGLNNYSYTYQQNSATWTSPPYDGIGDSCTNCTSVDRFQHLYYLSIRQNDTIVDPYEIAWNNLSNNPILEGIHIYDMSVTGSGFNAPIKVHNNVIRNQGGPAFDSSLPYDSEYAQIDFYNNIIITDSNSAWSGAAINTAGDEVVRIYNNTIYGYRIAGISSTSTQTVEARNNIFYDSNGFSFGAAPDTSSNNLFYSSESTAMPAWFSELNGDINANPLFVNTSIYDFSVQEGSPCIGYGYIVDYITDFFQQLRGGAFDIGAVEYAGEATPSYDPPTINAGANQTVYAATAQIDGTYTVDTELSVDVCSWSHGIYSGFCVAALGVISGTVTDLAIGENTVTIEIVDSEGQSVSDMVVFTRAEAPIQTGIVSTAVSHGVVKH